MAPATANHQTHTDLVLIGWFILGLLVFSALFSAIALPFIHLSWVQTFRRCVSIAAALSLYLVITRVERRSITSYGFSNLSIGTREFWFGCALGIGGLIGLCVIGTVLGAYHVELLPNRLKLWGVVLGFVPAAILIGSLEELVFRGFFFQHLKHYSQSFALIASSTLYAVVHLKSPHFSYLTWLELGGLFLLGGVLCLSYIKTQQLFLAVGLHATLAYGAIVNKLLIAISGSSLWLTGTSRLVNGLAGWLVLLIVGVVISRMTERGTR